MCTSLGEKLKVIDKLSKDSRHKKKVEWEAFLGRISRIW